MHRLSTLQFIFITFLFAGGVRLCAAGDRLVPKAESTPELGKKLAEKLPEGTLKISLKSKTIKSPETMLVPGDIDNKNYPKASELILPSVNTLSFRGTEDTAKLTLDGTEYTVVAFRNQILKGKRVKAKLKPDGRGLKTVKLKTDSKRTCRIAFPYLKREVVQGDQIMTLYYRSGITQRGEIGEDQFHLYDADTNGKYTVDADAFTIDSMRVFAPLAKILALPKGIYSLEKIENDGETLTVTPFAGDKQPLSVTTNDKKLDLELAFTGNNHEVAFLAQKDTTLDVPAGSYTLVNGLVSKRKKNDPVAFIQTDPPFTLNVEESKAATLALGEPYKLEFAAKPTEAGISIEQKSLQIVGCAGERYVGLRLKGSPKVYLQIGNEKPTLLGSFALNDDYRPTDFKGTLPSKDNKGNKLKGKCILSIEAEFEGFGELKGAIEYSL